MAPPDPFAERYANLRFVGGGGFGTVYRVDDLQLKCVRALKVLNANLASDQDYRARFRREAIAAAGLTHPNIAAVFDDGVFENQPFIVMEFVDGEPLSTMIEQRVPLPDPERLQLIEQLCDGLHCAHRSHIFHRDVKPGNLVVRQDQDGGQIVWTLKILDFGIARMENTGATLTGGQLLFTPNYVAPELIRGQAASAQSDMFAVGAVAYELLVFRKAFEIHPKGPFDLLDEVRRQIVERPHTPMTAIRPDIDPELVTIVDRALAKEPGRRYDNLADMRRHVAGVRQRLEAAAASRATGNGGETTIVLTHAVKGEVRPARRTLIPIVLSTVVVSALTVGALGYLSFRRVAITPARHIDVNLPVEKDTPTSVVPGAAPSDGPPDAVNPKVDVPAPAARGRGVPAPDNRADIRSTLQRLADAYGRRDATAAAALMVDNPITAMKSSLGRYRSYVLTLELGDIEINGDTARVTCLRTTQVTTVEGETRAAGPEPVIIEMKRGAKGWQIAQTTPLD